MVFQHRMYPHVPTNQASVDDLGHCSVRRVAHTSCSDHPRQKRMDARLVNEEDRATQGQSRKGAAIRHEPSYGHTRADRRGQQATWSAEAMSCASGHAHGVCVTRRRSVADPAIDRA